MDEVTILFLPEDQPYIWVLTVLGVSSNPNHKYNSITKKQLKATTEVVLETLFDVLVLYIVNTWTVW